jgi:hypothetical protein
MDKIRTGEDLHRQALIISKLLGQDIDKYRRDERKSELL